MDGSRSRSQKMPHERKSTLLYDHDYYGPLIDSYAKSILKSGLLLDEDLEVLLSVFKVRNGCEKFSYIPSFYLLGSICAMLGSTILAKMYNLPVIILPSVIVVVKVVHSEFKAVIMRKNDKMIIDTLIETMNGVQKLNLDIIQYLKIRNNLQNTNSTEYTLYSKSVEDFIRTFLRSKLILFQNFIKALRIVSEFCSDLSDDFKCLGDLNVPNIFTGDIDNVISEEYVQATEKMLDLHVLLTSKLLSYIGVLFYSETSRLNTKNVMLIINKMLPSIMHNLQDHLDDVRKLFNSLRCTANKVSEYAVTKASGNRQFLKLQKTLFYAVNNLSIILEKSLALLDRMEKSSGNDLKEIGTALENLKNQTYVTYESLDLLCRLHGIIENSNTTNQNTAKIVNVPEKKSSKENSDLPVVKYDDSTEPVEEKYELYLDEEINIVEHPTTTYDDQSGAYMSLLVEELKYCLKQHHRFIDMKNRRGSVDVDDDVIDKKDYVITVKKSLPKFNLDVLKPEGNQNFTPVSSSLLKLDEENAVKIANMPVPPPPPLPSFNLSNLDEETGQINARSMLENIRILANQRSTDVLVIGNCDSDIDNSDSDDA